MSRNVNINSAPVTGLYEITDAERTFYSPQPPDATNCPTSLHSGPSAETRAEHRTRVMTHVKDELTQNFTTELDAVISKNNLTVAKILSAGASTLAALKHVDTNGDTCTIDPFDLVTLQQTRDFKNFVSIVMTNTNVDLTACRHDQFQAFLDSVFDADNPAPKLLQHQAMHARSPTHKSQAAMLTSMCRSSDAENFMNGFFVVTRQSSV